MPRSQKEAEASLIKLGERWRAEMEHRHPLSPQALEGVRQAVRAQWEREEQVRHRNSGGKAGEQGRQGNAPQQRPENTAEQNPEQQDPEHDEGYEH